MVKQQVMAAASKYVRFPLWKRLILIAALLLPGETLIAVASSQAAHADPCIGGPGGHGGVATSPGNEGGRGGNGGDCTLYGSFKAGTGGASAVGANGGNVIVYP